MDRGAWWATVHGVTKSRTQLKRLSIHIACTQHAQRIELGCGGTRTLIYCYWEHQLLHHFGGEFDKNLVKLKLLVYIHYNLAISLLVYSLEILPNMCIMKHN